MNIFNRVFYNKKLNQKTWRINGVETDPTQNDDDDNLTINDKDIDLTISQEQGIKGILLTLKVDNKEYSFMLYDEIINFINKLNRR